MEELNINKAMSDPAGVFGRPENVLKNDSLTKSQKRDVLLRWQAEAIGMQNPGLQGAGEKGQNRVKEITYAIQKLA